MKKPEHFYVAVDGAERSMIIHALNRMRTSLINQGRYTDAVDNIMIKVASAPQKKFKIVDRSQDAR